MTENTSSFRYWVVNCLGCKNLIPLFAEPIDHSSSTPIRETTQERAYFCAWCVECGREYPYLSEAMIANDEPPLDKHHRQLEFNRLRQRFHVKRANT